MAWWCHLAIYIWFNIGLDNGLLPHGTKPLPDSMLTYDQWHSSGVISQGTPQLLITKIRLKIYYSIEVFLLPSDSKRCWRMKCKQHNQLHCLTNIEEMHLPSKTSFKVSDNDMITAWYTFLATKIILIQQMGFSNYSTLNSRVNTQSSKQKSPKYSTCNVSIQLAKKAMSLLCHVRLCNDHQ